MVAIHPNTSQQENTQSPIDLVLSRLPGYKAVSSGYSACCPAHNDKNPSLSIWEDEKGECGLKCYAGCSRKAICEALSIQEQELYRKTCKPRTPRLGITLLDLAVDKIIDPRLLVNWGLVEKNKAIRIPYSNMDGSEYSHARVRTTIKAKEGTKWELGAKSIPYGLDRLQDARDVGYLSIGEGESDVWTHWVHKLPALGIPGATMFNCIQAEHVASFPPVLYLMQESDDAGKQFVHGTSKRLAQLGYQGKVFKVDLKSSHGVKDPNDLHKKLHAEGRLSAFKDEWQKALDQATPVDIYRLPKTNKDPVESLLEEMQGIRSASLKAKSKFEPNKVTIDAVRKYYNMQEYGDGLLFAEVFKGLACYDHTEKKWYFWQGHWWKRDNTGLAKRLVSGYLGSVYLEKVAELNIKLAELAEEIVRHKELTKGEEDKDKLIKLKMQIEELECLHKYTKAEMSAFTGRSDELRKANRNKNVLSFAMSEGSIAVSSDIWDKNPWLLGVKNGVVDLRTGECRDGEPEDYIKSVSPTEWQGLATSCPRFEQFLEEIFEVVPERQEVISFLQRLFGYAITGKSSEAIFPILYGEEGRNGKDTLFGILKRVLGAAIANAISNDVLLSSSDKWKTSGAATPHLVDLQGKRIVWGSETKQGDVFNIAQVKHLTGGGSISARHLYGEQYSFDPTHTLFLMTNNKPHANAKDKAFWTRACLIEFHMRFVENPIEQNERHMDRSLNDELDKEASGIIAWLVRGCLEWQKQGLKRPEIVVMATEEYRKGEDVMQLFIDECCVEAREIKGQDLYKAYKEWCEENYYKPMNGNLFGKDLIDRYKYKKLHRKDGNYYVGIDLKGPFDGEGTDPFGEGTQNSLHTTSQADLPSFGEGGEGESGKGDNSSKNQFPIGDFKDSPSPPSPPSPNDNMKALLEPNEGASENEKVPSPDEKVPSPVPQKLQVLFNQYREHLKDKNAKDRKASLMWRAPDTGCKNEMLALRDHFLKTKGMLESGEEKQQEAAREAMERTLGVWGDE